MQTEGLRQGLACPLERTNYRFIGIWRFNEGKTNAAVHYDRENSQTVSTAEVPATATYCSHIHQSGASPQTKTASISATPEQPTANSKF